MKLRDYLSKLDPKTTVAIAPIDGTAFLYVGDAGDTKMMELIYEDIMADKKRLIDKYKHRIRMATTVSEYEYNRWVYAKTRLENEIRTIVPYLDREVVTTRVKEVDPGLAIFIEGNETARFWLKEEFKKYSRNLHAIL